MPERSGDSLQAGDGTQVCAGPRVDHVQSIVGRVRDIDQPAAPIDRGMIEASLSDVLREIAESLSGERTSDYLGLPVLPAVFARSHLIRKIRPLCGAQSRRASGC